MDAVSGYYGPKMKACMEWAKSEGHSVGQMSPLQFALLMDRISGVKHQPHDHPEVAAERWLTAKN